MSPDRTYNSLFSSLLVIVFEPEIRAWCGAQSLGKVFWGYGVIVCSALILLCTRTFYDGNIVMQEVLGILFGAYTVWVLVAVWRCAENANPFWCSLARWLTVAWAANTAFVLLFLQFQLLTSII
ncbi:hypothetical protein CW354_02525 [Marinicaulis flavus]|uniref:Uncharacterized protein n=1 Tax=Hyphococcus luteus TaxID=2058213 RepID=A0A2S7KBE0_9PROT|nr:hypothetical protein CW354_02525 [Marinicaulis flavus]